MSQPVSPPSIHDKKEGGGGTGARYNLSIRNVIVIKYYNPIKFPVVSSRTIHVTNCQTLIS